MAASILVVDDEEEIRASLRRGLSLEGFTVALAAGGTIVDRVFRRAELMTFRGIVPGARDRYSAISMTRETAI